VLLGLAQYFIDNHIKIKLKINKNSCIVAKGRINLESMVNLDLISIFASKLLRAKRIVANNTSCNKLTNTNMQKVKLIVSFC
jgi:hypothetical protein